MNSELTVSITDQIPYRNYLAYNKLWMTKKILPLAL